MTSLLDNYAVIYVHLEEPNPPFSALISASTSSGQSSNQSASVTDKAAELDGDDSSAVAIEAPVLSIIDNSKAIVIDVPGECHMIN